MKYTEDESSFLFGILASYLSYPGVQPVVRTRYATVCQHLNSGHLSMEDVHYIKNAFDLLLPQMRIQPEERNLLWSAYLTTKSILQQQ